LKSSSPPEVVRAGVLEVALERHGTLGGPAVVLLHGFPYDPRSFDEVVAPLVAKGAEVVVPYLRGYGATRFVDDAIPRSGQQAALAHDLLELISALDLQTPVVGGYDWGGRAACLVAALWPDLVAGLVTVDGYNVQDLASAGRPASPSTERALWYQYYFLSERGRAGLSLHRRELTRLLWSEWSPEWAFDDATFDASATSFDNPDFVDVVVHSYRHRHGLAPDDPAYAATERAIAQLTTIDVPTVILDPTRDGLGPPDSLEEHRSRFSQIVDHQSLPVGHNVPQEAPGAVVDAVAKLRF
jgi:pimeloyl-ACP methyl ester carboxylesterase